MNIHNKFLPLLLIFMILALACRKQEESSAPAEPGAYISASESGRPPYLRLPMDGVIPTIDPGLTVDTASIEITEQLFLGLTDFKPETYEVVPELADSWTVSEDGKVYRFNMRQDVTWTNNEPVTAHDLVWAIRRNIKPETRSPYAHSLYILKNAEAINRGGLKDASKIGVRSLDDFTVEFTLEHAAAYFPAMVGLWVYRPLPAKAIEEHGDEWTKPGNIRTNGSYILSEWKKARMLILKKNPNYYDARNVSIPEVHYYIIPESSAGLVMYKNNELDVIGGAYMRLPLTEIPFIKKHRVLSEEYSNNPELCTYSIGFNNKLPPVDNPLVRKAISAAIDRRLLVEIITQGDQEPATTFTRPPIFGSVDPKEGVGTGFDPGQAKKWLAQAGYPGGEGFPDITLMHNTSESHRAIALAIRTFLKHYLDINVKVRDKEWTEYMESVMQPHTPHMFRLGWCADYPDANNWLNEMFHPFKSIDRIGWKNTEFAELMDKAQKISDPDERKMLYKRAEQILTEEECAIMPLYFYTAQYLVKPWVRGWYHMAMGGQHIRNWSLDD